MTTSVLNRSFVWLSETSFELPELPNPSILSLGIVLGPYYIYKRNYDWWITSNVSFKSIVRSRNERQTND